MPPKKSTKAGSENEGSKGQGFKWTPEADLQLLYLMTVPRGATKEEQERIGVMLGVSAGAVRNRATTIKAAHRKAYEEAGWEIPGTTVPSKPSTPSRKRAHGGVSDENVASPRAKKTKKGGKAALSEEDNDESQGQMNGLNVKDEPKNEDSC
ncbi:hypothetical protein K504DRAFT_529264 [Pleomassaria siparia CBS 279.74]|uniref:Myb-like domain-containing protein n=1 Tax=Pleomassaria siparia CBS 279.74 TaxID=1314801 RepID=A0A6G1KQY0_9PLEO|nr:hypothetical protein K504DRAFT_529264 [Pleomassaria siparia CBS 279.74]